MEHIIEEERRLYFEWISSGCCFSKPVYILLLPSLCGDASRLSERLTIKDNSAYSVLFLALLFRLFPDASQPVSFTLLFPVVRPLALLPSGIVHAVKHSKLTNVYSVLSHSHSHTVTVMWSDKNRKKKCSLWHVCIMHSIMMIHSLASCDYIVMFAFWPVVTLERPCDGLVSCSGCALSGQMPGRQLVLGSNLLSALRSSFWLSAWAPLSCKKKQENGYQPSFLPSKLPTPCYSHVC